MKFYLLVVSLLLSIAYQAFGQVTVGGLQRASIDMNMRPGGVINTFPPPVREAIGSTYIDDNWLPGKIDLTNGQVIEDVLIRYDIETDRVEVRVNDELKGVKGENVKSFTVFNASTQSNDVFVNGRGYQREGNAHDGFFKLIRGGEWSLLEKTEVEFVKSTYNPVLGVGEEAPKYVKSKTLFVAAGASIFVVTKNKKKFLESLNDQSDKVSEYMKKMSLSLKDTEDIKLIVDFLNKRA